MNNCYHCSKNVKSCVCSDSLELRLKIRQFNEQYPIFVPNFPNKITNYPVYNTVAGEVIDYIINVTEISSPYVLSIEPQSFDIYVFGEFNVQVTYKGLLVTNCKYNITSLVPQNLNINLNLDSSFFQRSDTVDILKVSIQFLNNGGIRYYNLTNYSQGQEVVEKQYCTVLRLLSFFRESRAAIIGNISEVCNKAVNYLTVAAPSVSLTPMISYGQLYRSTDLKDQMVAIFSFENLSGAGAIEFDPSNIIERVENLNRRLGNLFDLKNFDIEIYSKQCISDMYSKKIIKLEKQVKALTDQLEIKENVKNLING
jgi:hypothetical protein